MEESKAGNAREQRMNTIIEADSYVEQSSLVERSDDKNDSSRERGTPEQ